MNKSIRNTPDTIIGGDVTYAHCKECWSYPEVQVMKTSGYYVGTACKCGPAYSRETEYFKTREEAEALLDEVGTLVEQRQLEWEQFGADPTYSLNPDVGGNNSVKIPDPTPRMLSQEYEEAFELYEEISKNQVIPEECDE